MKQDILELGKPVKDSFTGMVGILTHYQLYGNDNTFYLFQPKGLVKATGKPLPSFWLTDDRIMGVKIGKTTHHKVWQTKELPIEIIGTKVKVPNYAFGGTVTSIELHINGCIHAYVQPSGLQDTGERFGQYNFDMRELTGRAITKLTKKEEEKSKVRTPSPAPVATSIHN